MPSKPQPPTPEQAAKMAKLVAEQQQGIDRAIAAAKLKIQREPGILRGRLERFLRSIKQLPKADMDRAIEQLANEGIQWVCSRWKEEEFWPENTPTKRHLLFQSGKGEKSRTAVKVYHVSELEPQETPMPEPEPELAPEPVSEVTPEAESAPVDRRYAVLLAAKAQQQAATWDKIRQVTDELEASGKRIKQAEVETLAGVARNYLAKNPAIRAYVNAAIARSKARLGKSATAADLELKLRDQAIAELEQRNKELEERNRELRQQMQAEGTQRQPIEVTAPKLYIDRQIKSWKATIAQLEAEMQTLEVDLASARHNLACYEHLAELHDTGSTESHNGNGNGAYAEVAR